MMGKYRIVVFLTMIILLSAFTLVGCNGKSAIEDIKWILASYGDPANPTEVLPDNIPTARFDSEIKEIRGSGGCNTYFGTYEVDGKDLTMTGPFAVTEMWCGDEIGAQESEFLDILLSADRYDIEGDILTLYSGGNILEFEQE